MIIVIGNRFGFLIPPLLLLSAWGVQTVTDAHFGDRYFEKHLWCWSIGVFLSAGVCWFLGQKLRGLQPPIVDQKTGREPGVGSAAYARYAMREIERESAFSCPRDSFFFLPVLMWGPILAVIGCILLIASWSGITL